MDCENHYEKARRIKIEGHRGGRLDYENTLNAYQLAIDHKLDSIEFDIWLTRDKVPIVIHGAANGTLFHDSEVGDIPQGSLFNDLTLEQLKGVVLPNGQAIPTFEELLDLCIGKIYLNCEIKEKNVEVCHILMDILKARNVTNKDLHFSSFKHFQLEELKRLDPSFEFSYLYEPWDEMIPDEYMSHGDIISINHHVMTKEIVDNCHKSGKKVAVWFCARYPESIEYYPSLVEHGIDILITDKPIEFQEFIANLQPTIFCYNSLEKV